MGGSLLHSPLYDILPHLVVKMKWYEQVTNADPLFGGYVEEILGEKLTRALPNHVVMMPSVPTVPSVLLIEKLTPTVWYCPECDDCSKWNLL